MTPAAMLKEHVKLIRGTTMSHTASELLVYIKDYFIIYQHLVCILLILLHTQSSQLV